jgi:hypothetical protein
MSEDPDAATLRALRSLREQVGEIARRRHAANPTILLAGASSNTAGEGFDSVQLVVDFDDDATLLDQVGLSLDLADLLDREIPVRSRRSVAEAPGSPGDLEPL